MLVGGAETLTFATATLIVSLTAIAARWIVFGNPLVHIDEEFYLLVGSRMLHGAIPYVDIWDRKPIGLFLLFAGARWLGGDGVLEYQILALLCVIATALLVFAMARRIASPMAALGAAMLYILYLNLAGGEAGQAPVWYNLPVAGAIAIIFFARSADQSRAGGFRWPGAAAMGLFGIALQIKYSAVFEGVFAGVALILLSRRRGRSPESLILDSGLWIGCALAPTALAAGVYAWLGHFHDWLFANFVSIMERGVEPASTVRWRIAEMAMILAPLIAAALLRRRLGMVPSSPRARSDLRFLEAWAAASLAGVVLFGTWFTHYALPTFTPLTIIVAPLVAHRRGRLYFGMLLIGAGVWGQHILHRHIRTRGDARLLAEVTQAVSGHGNCIFVYDGLVALYDSAQSCLPTTHVFPTHFAGAMERGATGIDQAALVGEVMARRPDRITSVEPAYDGENLAARAALYRVLDADYVPISRIARWNRTIVVYALRGT